MKESYSEIVAEYAGPESYADDGNIVGVATAGVHAGPEIELRYQAVSRAHTVKLVEGNIGPIVSGEIGSDAAESKAWSVCGNFKHENREIPSVPWVKP